jgi:hypothetical protein
MLFLSCCSIYSTLQTIIDSFHYPLFVNDISVESINTQGQAVVHPRIGKGGWVHR